MYTDPLTGDQLTKAEHVSWRLQSTIRNFWFIAVITGITIYMAVKGQVWNLEAVDSWNFCMSWLALWIESIVGIAMFNQTRRDAKVLRDIKGMEEKLSTVLMHVESVLAHVEELAEGKES